MKQKLLLIVFLLTSVVAGAQIPNWDWESWTAHTTDAPAQWRIFGTTSKATPAQNGQYAVKLQSDGKEPGAIVYGNPDDNGFSGGTPFAARPDSLIAYIKYDIAANDSAFVIISLQQAGVAISNDIYTYKGNSGGNFVRRAFKINYTASGNADTIFLAFSSTDIDQANTNSYVIIDNVSFIGTATNVPNPDFENWTMLAYDEPNGWGVENNYARASATKSTDAYAGTYALKLMTTINGSDTTRGYATTRPWDDFQFGPSFPVSTKPDSLTFFAKYMPVNGDSAQININLFQAGMPIGMGSLKIGGTHATYTPFAVHINYPMSGTPDSATIEISTFLMDMGNYQPRGASVLYIDNMSFDHYAFAGIEQVIAGKPISIYPNPAQNKVFAALGNTNAKEVAIQLIDMNGKVIIGQTAKVTSQIVALDISSISAAGIYFLKIDTGKETLIGKVFKD